MSTPLSRGTAAGGRDDARGRPEPSAMPSPNGAVTVAHAIPFGKRIVAVREGGG
jgi:hypothetical protein